MSKIIDTHKAILDVTTDQDPVPWYVTCLFSKNLQISFSDEHICLGEDYMSIDDARGGIAWLVDQLGGKVKWGK